MQRWNPRDEVRHDDAPVEAWWWWGAGEADLAGERRRVGVVVGLELRAGSFDYWAGVVRAGYPYLYVEELDGRGLRPGLELKPPEMWAGHTCDVPFRQWSVGNEAHGVLLDDPTEAWRRAHGEVVPVAADVEWYATAEPFDVAGLAPGADGYEQVGEVDVRVELLEGVLAFTGPGRRVHVWGAPYVPRSLAMPIDHRGLRAPYRRREGALVDQVLTDAGWWVSA